MLGPVDGYEARYMAAARSVARVRQRMPASYHLVLGLPLACLLTSIALTHVYPLLALVPVWLLVWVLFLYLRVTVSRTHVHIQLGLFGPKIPLTAIDEARVCKYDSAKYGDKAIRTASDGSTAYYVGCETGVELSYRDEKGRQAKVFASCEDAATVVEAIRQAQVETSAAMRVPARVATDVRTAEDEALPVETDEPLPSRADPSRAR